MWGRIISTHALTEGDVTVLLDSIVKWLISTHALTEGDGDFPQLNRFYRSYFNSRPHGGRLLIEREESCRYISTHALTEGDDSASSAELMILSFQLTPSRRATEQLLAENEQLIISTHALTEGDPLYQDSDENYQAFQLTPSRRATCKFRQIFLLNRGYAYSISLYFLPHFISLLPQILSFQQKPFKFQVRIFLLFSVHLAFALQNQCVHHVKSRFCTNMFYFVFVLFTQIVKSQTISLFIYDFF